MSEKIEEQETKVKSFRITDDTAEKFKEIAATIGGNQQETLAKLIENYEMQAGKAAFTDTRAEIEQFEGYTIALNRMFMTAIESQQNMKNLVKAEFDAQLKSKDAIIIDLQKQIEALDAKAKEIAIKEKESLEIVNNIKKEADDAKNNYEASIKVLKDKLDAKEQLNIALSDSLDSLKLKCNDLQATCNSLTNAKEQYNEDIKQLTSKNDESQKELANIHHENEMLKLQLDNNKKTSEFNLQKAVMETEREYGEKLDELKKICEEKLERAESKTSEYQNKYIAAVEKVQSLISKADSGIDEGIELVKNIINEYIKEGKINELDRITTMSRNEIYSYKK